jgi:hypothetical protein
MNKYHEGELYTDSSNGYKTTQEEEITYLYSIHPGVLAQNS